MAVLEPHAALPMDSLQEDPNTISDTHSNSSGTASNAHYHTAFMQCRACCNCDSGCSYYGKGKFNTEGKYIGN